jgi:hypothetical protein
LPASGLGAPPSPLAGDLISAFVLQLAIAAAALADSPPFQPRRSLRGTAVRAELGKELGRSSPWPRPAT